MKILYVPPRGIGDLVFSLPLLHSLHSAFPQADIHVPTPNDASKKEMHALVGFLKATSRYLPLPSQDPLADQRWKASQARDTKRKMHFEQLIFDKYLDQESYDLALLPKPFSISTIHCPTQINENDLKEKGLQTSNMHMVDRFLAFVPYLNIPQVLSFQLSLPDETSRAAHMQNIPSFETHYIVCNLGSSSSTRQWPAQAYQEVAAWTKQKQLAVVLVGTGNEYGKAQAIMQDSSNIVSLVPQTGYALNLEQYALLAKDAAVVIGPDSGFLHLADAVGSKVIGLYGPGNPDKYAPYQNKSNLISRYHVDKDTSKIPANEVIQKLEALL